MQAVIQKGYGHIRTLGAGGEGRIYLCEQSGHDYVLKVIPRLGESGLKLLDEIAAMDNAHLPRFREVFSDKTRTYIVREYIEGVTLEELLKREKRLPYPRAKQIVLALCEALRALHGALPAPIIHRDLKPENIIVTPQGEVKLIDFGIARRHSREAVRDTVIAGTTGYTAPEVMAGIQSDARSDIYSLGLILYEMLTGKSLLEPPYQIRPLAENGSAAPKRADRIIRKATDYNQIFRHESVEAFAKDIRNAGKVSRSRIAGITAAAAAISAATLVFLSRAAGMPSEAPVVIPPASLPAVTSTASVIPSALAAYDKDYSGRDIDAVCAELAREGVYPLVYSMVTDAQDKGCIVSQTLQGETLVFTVCTGPPVEQVVFADARLEEIVRTLLGISQEEGVSSQQMEALTALDGYGANGIEGISSLSGLEYAVNLDTLNIHNCEVSDITPIQNLGKLEQLRIYTCKLTDISGLARLRNLTALNIDENYITDISALTGLRLEELSMGHNSIIDISALESSDNLTFLSIRSNRVADISVLSDCGELTIFWADNNRISDIRALSGMGKLEEIELGNNEYTDLEALGGLANLRVINLSHVEVEDYTPLLRCAALKEVMLGADSRMDEATRILLEQKGVRVTTQG